MLYVRGNPQFRWLGTTRLPGLMYQEVLPYFRSSENYKQGSDTEFRGDGPLEVEDYRTVLPLTHRFVRAAQEAGHPLTPDYNGAQQEGVGYSQMTRRGRFRGSTAQTYLRAVKGNPNLEIVTCARGGRLIFEGRKCVGITYRQDGSKFARQ